MRLGDLSLDSTLDSRRTASERDHFTSERSNKRAEKVSRVLALKRAVLVSANRSTNRGAPRANAAGAGFVVVVSSVFSRLRLLHPLCSRRRHFRCGHRCRYRRSRCCHHRNRRWVLLFFLLIF
uniref:Uncharacterized protein n=1 Tax=Sipha flava TaxID=143950 RepID=A0A2S2QRL8_9HEMI